jgi:Mg2+/Co2+ transporter CorC
VVTTLGRIPSVGESVRVGDLSLSVIEAEPMRVVRVRLEVVPPEEDEPGEPESDPGAVDGITVGRREESGK